MRILLLLCLSIGVAGAALADATQDALSEFVKCAGIKDSSERLTCFDAAALRARTALTELQAPEKRGILDWFGFSRPRKPVIKPDDFGKPQPPPAPGEITQIGSTVLEFAKTLRGKGVFILENGQVWRQLDGDDTVVYEAPPGTAMKVTIELGFLESYNLMIEGRNGIIKVRRLK